MSKANPLVSLDALRLKIEQAAKDTVLAKIELGGYLQQARDHFKANQEFGRWCEENIPWMSQPSAFEHMQVFNKFANRLSDGRQLPNYTVLRELARNTTPPKAVKAVLERGEDITVQDAKKIIRSYRVDEPTKSQKSAEEKWDAAYEKARDYILKLNDEYRERLLPYIHGAPEASTFSLPIKERVAHGNPYVVLGLAPGSGKEAIKAVYQHLSRTHHPDKGGDTEVMAAINKAYKEILRPNWGSLRTS